jgi:hypothetical protein
LVLDLENCYAAKAFAWNALGKLFSSSDVEIIKKHFNEATDGKVKLWELLHHGIKYSKEQLGISPNVMESYADRIFHLMKEKYYARYSQEVIAQYSPESVTRKPYTLPKECIMLPYFRSERDKGEHMNSIPHEFSSEVVATKKGVQSSKRIRISSRGRNVSTNKDTNKGETSRIVVIDEDPLVVDVIEKSDKRKSSKPKDSERSLGKEPAATKKEHPRKKKRKKPSSGKTSREILSKKPREDSLPTGKLLELLKESTEDLERELLAARKKIKTLEDNAQKTTFSMNAHSERIYTEFCMWYDTIWTSSFHKTKPATTSELESFFQRYLYHKPPHYSIEEGHVVTTPPEITMDKETTPLSYCIKSLDKVKSKLGENLLDLSKVHIEPKVRSSQDEDRIRDLMMIQHKYLDITSTPGFRLTDGITPVVHDLDGGVSGAIERYSNPPDFQESYDKLLEHKHRILDLKQYFLGDDSEGDVSDLVE